MASHLGLPGFILSVKPKGALPADREAFPDRSAQKMANLKTIQTKVLEIAFLDEGLAAGWPVILAHGFPTTSMPSMRLRRI